MPEPKLSAIMQAMTHLGFRIFDGVDHHGKWRDLDVNIFGLRTGDMHSNQFDDWLGIFWKREGANDWEYHVWPATTDPGVYYRENPINVLGTAILVEGNYPSSHKLGLHRGRYQALVQNSPLPVYRDGNKDKILDMKPGTVSSGHFGINIHRASASKRSEVVDKWSAGCQVLADPRDFDELIDICVDARDIWGPTFSYTLLTEQQLAVSE